MPTTRSRSRAPKEPSIEDLEDLEERIEEYSKELHERLKKAFTIVEEELHDLTEEHNRLVEDHNKLLDSHKFLWDWHWHQEHVALHREEQPSAFGWLAVVVCSFCFNPEIVPAVLIGWALDSLLHAFKN